MHTDRSDMWMEWVAPVKVYIQTVVLTLFMIHAPVKAAHSFSLLLWSTKAAQSVHIKESFELNITDLEGYVVGHKWFLSSVIMCVFLLFLY